jgi:AcrR family transcriptional regulator
MTDPDPGTVPRIRRDARENRARLLAAAKTLFAERGAQETTMQEVARAAGVGQGTLYRHFADKSELCQALIKEDIAAFQERVGAVIGSDWALASPLARLDTLLAEKVRLTEGHLPLFAAMDAGGTRRPKPFRGPFHLWLHERLVTLLEEALAHGEVVAIDPPLVADLILAATAPPLYAHQRNDQGYSPERVIASLRRIFVQALHHDSV